MKLATLARPGRDRRLVGDFADSPLVADRGSASQWMAAAGVTYTF